MSGEAAHPDLEALLRRALRPVDPPADLSARLESRLETLTVLAADELESWELSSMRDPRNWAQVARPVAAAVVGTTAGAALVVLRTRRRAQQQPSARGRAVLEGPTRAARDAVDGALRGARRLGR